MYKENLIHKGAALAGWKGEIVAEIGEVKARLFRLTPDKEMIIDEEGHHMNEWVLVLSGELIVQTPQKTLTLFAGESFIIPPGVSHRLNVNAAEAIVLIIRDLDKDPVRVLSGSVVDKT